MALMGRATTRFYAEARVQGLQGGGATPSAEARPAPMENATRRGLNGDQQLNRCTQRGTQGSVHLVPVHFTQVGYASLLRHGRAYCRRQLPTTSSLAHPPRCNSS